MPFSTASPGARTAPCLELLRPEVRLQIACTMCNGTCRQDAIANTVANTTSAQAVPF